jgi:hypothetical protein
MQSKGNFDEVYKIICLAVHTEVKKSSTVKLFDVKQIFATVGIGDDNILCGTTAGSSMAMPTARVMIGY